MENGRNLTVESKHGEDLLVLSFQDTEADISESRLELIWKCRLNDEGEGDRARGIHNHKDRRKSLRNHPLKKLGEEASLQFKHLTLRAKVRYKIVNKVNKLVKESILVIDDDLDYLKLVSKVLSDEGYEVDVAKSGQEAIEKCIKNFYSLMLIDIKLPDVEGIELLTRIKDTDPKIRKVIITGYPGPENMRQALNLGADAYLIKPVEADELLETVRKQLLERDREFAEKYSLLKSLESQRKD